MKQLLLLCTVFFMITGCKENKTKKQDTSSEWISLFDGSSLDGWRAYNGESLPQGWLFFIEAPTIILYYFAFGWLKRQSKKYPFIDDSDRKEPYTKISRNTEEISTMGDNVLDDTT